MREPAILGLVLAGGRSSRMGQDKALLEIGTQSLLSRAIERLAPQVGGLAVSSNSVAAGLDVDMLPDAEAHRYLGPLAGILAGLVWAEKQGAARLATVAVDTPFFPADLVARLAATGAQAAVASSGGRLHPAFALWPVSALEVVRAHVEGADRSIMGSLRAIGFTEVAFDDGADPFLNINTPAELDEARRLLADGA